jgi:hypothetical protein
LFITLDWKRIMNEASPRVDFRTDPSQYRHWNLSFEGQTATLAMNVAEDGGIRPGYKLKLNSYDLGVDIELHDAIQRIRFEHPEVRSVIVTSLKDRVFCSGANIFMLGLSTHAWKVNFCKFTNETGWRIRAAMAASNSSPPSMAPVRGAAMSWQWLAMKSILSMTGLRRSPCPKCRCWASCLEPAA